MTNPFEPEAAASRVGWMVPHLRTALWALEAEDRRLRLALEQAGARIDPAYNRGLVYGVFEQNLVYEIFKAWLPVLETHWEVPYPGSREKADLVLFEKGAPSVIVEAKWWMNNQAKMLGLLDQDVQKLRSWSGTSLERVLLGFWYSKDTVKQWAEDQADIREFCARHGGRVTPVFAGSFATDWEKHRGGEGAYFAMTALHVSA